MLSSADLRCSFVILRCLLSEHGAYSSLLHEKQVEEQIASSFGEGRSVDTHFHLLMGSINFFRF